MLKIIIYLVLSTGGMTLYKIGSSNLNISASKQAFSLTISPLSILGMCCYLCSFLMWLMILKQGDLSRVFPIVSSLAIVATAILGMCIGENITATKIIGMAVIIAGVIIVGYSK